MVGIKVGFVDGSHVGLFDGIEDGYSNTCSGGFQFSLDHIIVTNVGREDGIKVGPLVGFVLGSNVGIQEGRLVGRNVGQVP